MRKIRGGRPKLNALRRRADGMSRFANQKVYWSAISGWRLGETLLEVRASLYVDDGVKDLHRISKGSEAGARSGFTREN